MLEQLGNLHRSLFGQVAVLSSTFLLLALALFVFVPFLARQELHPLERTRALAETAIEETISIGSQDALTTLSDSPVIREIAAANPDFRYSIRIGQQEVRFGPVPEKTNAPQTAVASAAPSVPVTPFEPGQTIPACEPRGYWVNSFDDKGVLVEVAYRQCGGSTVYTEVGGIANPVPRFTSLLSVENLKFIWESGKGIVIATAGFTIIVLLVFLYAARALGRVTRVVETLDVDDLGAPLPAEGLPLEIVPLVESINSLIGKLRASQEQQSFFLAAAAHELRTPMSILKLRINELPDNETKEEVKTDMRRITALVDQLLTLMDVNNWETPLDQVDLNRLVTRLVEKKRPLCDSKSLTFDVRTPSSPVNVRGDKTLVEIAISNLIDNAISFSSSGDPICVEITPKGQVIVQDHGPGIPPALQDKLFEPFAKSPPNRRGHGLGLAIVSAVAARHGGRVEVANRADGGASFTLSLVNSGA